MNGNDGQTPFFRPGVSGSGPSVQNGLSVIGPAASSLLPTKPVIEDSTKQDAITKLVYGSFVQGIKEAGEARSKELTLAGMQAAAAGRSLQDIQDEQPWYSKIFGKSDVITGAEAYVKATRASETMLQVQRDMPSLRTMEPEQFRAELIKRFESAKTGVPDLDVDIQSQLLNKVPALMDNQLKQNYQFKQEEYSKTQRTHLVSAFNELNETLRNLSIDAASPSGREAAAMHVLRFDADVARVAGQDLDAYHNNTHQGLKTLAGNIGMPYGHVNPDGSVETRYQTAHGFQALLASSKAYHDLPDHMKQDILETVRKRTMAAAVEFAKPYTNELAKIDTLLADPPRGISVPSLIKRKKEIEDKVRRDLGSPFDIYDANEQRRDATRVGLAIARKEEAARAQAEAERIARSVGRDKEAEEEGTVAYLKWVQAYDPGKYKEMKGLKLYPSKIFDRVENEGYLEQKTPEAKLNHLAQLPDIVEVAKYEFRHQSDQFFNKPAEVVQKSTDEGIGLLTKFLEEYSALGPEKTAAYYGPATYKALIAGKTALERKQPPEVVIQQMHSSFRRQNKPTVSDSDIEESGKLMQKQASVGAFGTFLNSAHGRNRLTGTGIRADENRGLAMDIAQRYKELRDALPSAPEANLWQMAQNDVTGKGAESTYDIMGGIVVEKMYPGQPSAQDYLLVPPGNRRGIPADAIPEAVAAVIEKYLGPNVQGHNLRFSNSGNLKHLVLTTYNEQADLINHMIPLDDILDAYHSKRKQRKKDSRYTSEVSNWTAE